RRSRQKQDSPWCQVAVLAQAERLSELPAMMLGMAPEQSSQHPLVGRADELDRLAELVGLVRPSNGREQSVATPSGAVLLAGDAGVGKTRLLAELRDRSVDAGWRVLIGHCLDFGDSALPYLPFSEAFGRLAGEAPALAASLVEAHPSVARLMPRRRLMGGDGASGEAGDRSGDGVARMDRGELFEAVHAAL